LRYLCALHQCHLVNGPEFRETCEAFRPGQRVRQVSVLAVSPGKDVTSAISARRSQLPGAEG
jgi:hypothetical protein